MESTLPQFPEYEVSQAMSSLSGKYVDLHKLMCLNTHYRNGAVDGIHGCVDNNSISKHEIVRYLCSEPTHRVIMTFGFHCAGSFVFMVLVLEREDIIRLVSLPDALTQALLKRYGGESPLHTNGKHLPRVVMLMIDRREVRCFSRGITLYGLLNGIWCPEFINQTKLMGDVFSNAKVSIALDAVTTEEILSRRLSFVNNIKTYSHVVTRRLFEETVSRLDGLPLVYYVWYNAKALGISTFDIKIARFVHPITSSEALEEMLSEVRDLLI
jgi:hypothetical protein